ncbi:hypothetical protein GT347_21495 [Xylophilus rhododendri]|uniref:SGNH/GDSL hydrolase family protein n=1 Tax=Xylophilus rhododendri TaxID=2697032 RepID=A0A857JEN0_9BURK|nr:hypothetical protein GT347_21495 [Xylophilus rhododendri]
MLRGALLAALTLLAGAGAIAQIRPMRLDIGSPAPASVLYIGSSFFYYNNGINNIVGNLARAGDPPARPASTMITISGAGFDWHDVDSYFRPDAVARYTIDRNNELHFNSRSPLFDVAIMMDCSQCALHPDLKANFHAYAKKDAEIVRKHGARPVFFMSWAYQDHPEMTQGLAEAYTQIGNDNDALVIPAGLAFARSLRDHPEIPLYVADKRHPTLAGGYLAAATTYATIWRRSPVGLKETAGLPADVALALQTAAWATVQDYFGARN